MKTFGLGMDTCSQCHLVSLWDTQIICKEYMDLLHVLCCETILKLAYSDTLCIVLLHYASWHLGVLDTRKSYSRFSAGDFEQSEILGQATLFVEFLQWESHCLLNLSVIQVDVRWTVRAELGHASCWNWEERAHIGRVIIITTSIIIMTILLRLTCGLADFLFICFS